MGFAGPTLIHCAVGDLNADGKPDVVTTAGNGTVSVFLNSSM